MSAASQAVDSYHLYLGIPPEEQPPNHYRLLGLTRFEANAAVVDAATNRVATYLQEVQCGPDREIVQALLREVAVARRVLLDDQRRAAYDATLRNPDREQEPLRKTSPTDCISAVDIDPLLLDLSTPSRQRKAKPESSQSNSGSTYRPVLIGTSTAAVLAITCLIVFGFSSGERPSESESTGDLNSTASQKFEILDDSQVLASAL